jgi:hypothetical protein
VRRQRRIPAHVCRWGEPISPKALIRATCTKAWCGWTLQDLRMRAMVRMCNLQDMRHHPA